jgi:hypothetical protein
MHEAGTAVMTLGNLGRGIGAQISPQWFYNPMPGNRTASPQQPQNLPRPTLQNGPHALGRVLGNVVEISALGNLGKVASMLGDAPQPPPPVDPVLVDAPVSPAPPHPNPMMVDAPVYDARDPYAPMVEQGWLTPGQADAYRTWAKIMVFVRPVSAAASAYHGYRRNNSLGWALGWGILGGLFPLITPTIGLAQGWGKRKR